MIRYADIFPATITPRPPEVPENTKLRILITDEFLTVGWVVGVGYGRWDLPLEDGDVSEAVTYAGGEVRGYTIARSGQCSTCGGGRRMQSWVPFPGETYIEQPRKLVAAQQIQQQNQRERTGLIPKRYSRR